jgi:translation initiation factor 3 subunit A
MKRQNPANIRNAQLKTDMTLKRAEELIKTDQKGKLVAFSSLHEIILVTNKKTKQPWSEAIEQITLRFIELCVELKKSVDAKAALTQYRNLCTASNMDNFITSMDYIVDLSEKDVKNSSPGEAAEAASKFLWETYRFLLDLSRNNPKLETKYEVIAGKAFDFCLTNKKKQEFRKLCEAMRMHPQVVNRESTSFLQLTTKFKQLNVACELELWQDAYRSVEDVNNALSLYEKVPETSFMISYYENMTKIFWVSKNHLFHAFSLYKLYLLKKKTMTDAAKRSVCTTLLLAILSIPLITDDEDYIAKEKLIKLASLLGSTCPPTRSSLLEEFEAKNLVRFVEKEVLHAHTSLKSFNPLELCSEMNVTFEYLAKNDKEVFVAPLQEITVTRLIQTLSQAYSSIRIDFIAKLVPFMNIFEIERILATQNAWNAQIDHVQGTISFGSCQNTNLKDQLVLFAAKISKAYALLTPTVATVKPEEIAKAIEEERNLILKRRLFMERKKKWEEEQDKIKEKLKQEKQSAARELRAKEEEERAKKELEKREEMRKKQEEEKNRDVEMLKELKKLMEVGSSSKSKKAKKINEAELKGKKLEEVLRELKEELERDAVAKERRLLEETKNLDYLERAKREIELPRIDKTFNVTKQKEIEEYAKYLEESKVAHEQKIVKDKAEHDRLERMKAGKERFLGSVMEKRKEQFEAAKIDYVKRMAEAKKKWEDRRAQLQKEVEARKKEDEEKKKIAEEKEKQKKEDAERLKKAGEIQRQKEEEIERKLREKSGAKPEEPKKPSRWGNVDDKPSESSGTSSRWGSSTQSQSQSQSTSSTGSSRWSNKPVEEKKEEVKKDGGSRWSSSKPEEKKEGGSSGRW